MSLPSWTKPITWSADVWAYGLLTLGTVTAFCQVLTFDFVNYDDDVYVTNNLDIQAGGGVLGSALVLVLVLRGWLPFLCVALGVWIYTDAFDPFWLFLTARKSAHWHPLTWASLATDYEIYGLHAWGFHLTNLLLHLANTLLLYTVLRRSTQYPVPSTQYSVPSTQYSVPRTSSQPWISWRCFTVAALFAWHPLHVESVAWITERKDVLSTFFWMLTMLAYLDYVAAQSVARESSPRENFRLDNWLCRFVARGLFPNQQQHKKYRLMIWLFILGLFSKPMIVTLPCVLLLWDVWPLRRVSLTSPIGWGRVLMEKTELLILAVMSGILTTVVMSQGPMNNMGEVLTLGGRFANAMLAMVFYLKKMFWPSGLGPSYPVFIDGPPLGEVMEAGLILAICSVLALCLVRRAPYLLIGWLWFVGTVLPVSLRLQKGSFTWADRYTYVPLIGVFIAIVWGIGDLASRLNRHSAVVQISLAMGVLLACLAATWQQVKIWRNSETLWTRTLELTPDHFIASINLAAYLEREGRSDEALQLLQKAVQAHPNVARGHRELGLAYEKRDRLEEALACFRKAVALDPDNILYRGPLVNVLRKLGYEREAKEEEARLSIDYQKQRKGM